MNYYYLITLFISHIGFFYFGYKFGKKVSKWEFNQKKFG